MEGLTLDARRAPEPYERPDLYDLLFSGYRHDLPFYTGLARAARGPVLELACGTGRTLLPILESGVDAEGVDLHPGMLERLRDGARARGMEPLLHVGSMSAFSLPRPFALVLVTFNSFTHNLGADDQLATLRRCHEHLLPGGALAMDVFSPAPAMLAEPGGAPVLELEVGIPGGGRLRLWDERRLDFVAQTQHSRLKVEELDPGGGITATHLFETTVRWIYHAEMELLLRAAGFARWEITGGFDGRPFTGDSGELVVRAWKAPA